MEKKKLLIIELNEFNEGLLQKFAKKYQYKNITKYLFKEKTEISIDLLPATEKKENILEPWVQWVSFHNGISTSSHKVRRFCEHEFQPKSEFWNKLEEQGVKCSVWNTYNSEQGLASVYYPLAWNAEQSPDHQELAPLFDLAKYSAINYTKISLTKLIGLFLRLQISIIQNFGFNIAYLKEHYWLAKSIASTRRIVAPAGYLEYIGIKFWMKTSKRNDCHFNLVCIHILAHLQHNYWNSLKSSSWKYGLFWLDKMFLEINKKHQNDSKILINGISQHNFTESGVENYIYKLKNPNDFLSAIGVRDFKIYPHMTAENTLEFNSIDLARKANHILSEIKVDGKKAFEVYLYDQPKLYFRLCIHSLLERKTTLEINPKKSLNFYDYFKSLGLETGCHSNTGMALTEGIILPKMLNIVEFKNRILEFYAR